MCSSVLELISLCISHICGISTYTIWNIELLLVIVEIVAVIVIVVLLFIRFMGESSTTYRDVTDVWC